MREQSHDFYLSEGALGEGGVFERLFDFLDCPEIIGISIVGVPS